MHRLGVKKIKQYKKMNRILVCDLGFGFRFSVGLGIHASVGR